MNTYASVHGLALLSKFVYCTTDSQGTQVHLPPPVFLSVGVAFFEASFEVQEALN
jgi:hypothetical protein